MPTRSGRPRRMHLRTIQETDEYRNRKRIRCRHRRDFGGVGGPVRPGQYGRQLAGRAVAGAGDTGCDGGAASGWMDLPGPTDVMAFPMGEADEAANTDAESPALLGDIVLCPDFAGEQARKAGHSLDDELHLLTVHGVLHLLG